jgi:hypothetical protein
VTKSKQPFLIRILAWFAALASLGMYLSIVLAILDIGPHIMGGETAYNSGEPVCEAVTHPRFAVPCALFLQIRDRVKGTACGKSPTP